MIDNKELFWLTWQLSGNYISVAYKVFQLMSLQQVAWPVGIKSYYLMISECSANKSAYTFVLRFLCIHKVLLWWPMSISALSVSLLWRLKQEKRPIRARHGESFYAGQCLHTENKSLGDKWSTLAGNLVVCRWRAVRWDSRLGCWSAWGRVRFRR